MHVQASQLPRVIACNGSISMEASPASIELPADDREEGIAAHQVASAVLTGLISDPVEYVERKTGNGIFVTPEMAENVAVFTDHVANMGYTGEAIIGVEQDVTFEVGSTGYVIGARPDWFAYDTVAQVLHIKDFKYGFRIVEPYNNWTLIAYAIGIAARYNIQPQMIVVEIVQPRPHHSEGKIREWSFSRQEMTAFYLSLVGIFANLTNQLNTGEHCRQCKALAICAAAKNAGYNAIEASTVAFTDQLNGEALAYEIRMLRRAEQAIKLKLEAYEELAIYRIDHSVDGVNAVPGFNSEQQYGNRAFNGGLTAEVLSIMVGKPVDQLTTRKLITPAALERLGVDENVVSKLTYRPPTRRKLVEFNPTKKAKKLFGA